MYLIILYVILILILFYYVFFHRRKSNNNIKIKKNKKEFNFSFWNIFKYLPIFFSYIFLSR